MGQIQQTTFADWALELLEHEVKPANPAERLRYWFQTGPGRPQIDDMAPGRFKGSIRFMRWLDRVLELYEANAVPDTDYFPWDGAKLDRSTIVQWHDIENKHEPLMKRRERVLARIKRWQEMQLEKVWEVHLKKRIQKRKPPSVCANSAKKMEVVHSVFFVPGAFQGRERPAFLNKEMLSFLPEPIRMESETYMEKKRVQPEDFAPLLYIRSKLFGIHGDLTFDHTVIDEAQDFSPFQVSLLRLHTRNDSFSILGDLSQGIHSYQGINDWREFSDLFGEGRSAYFALNRSYRSTMEIIRFANEVLRGGMAEEAIEAIPVFRSGEPVKIVQVDENKLTAALKELSGGCAEIPIR